MIEHDTRPCTPNGHSAYRGYDAIEGKLRSLHGHVFTCQECMKRFGDRMALQKHQHAKHSGGAA